MMMMSAGRVVAHQLDHIIAFHMLGDIRDIGDENLQYCGALARRRMEGSSHQCFRGGIDPRRRLTVFFCSFVSHLSASASQRLATSLKLRFNSADPMVSAKARALAAASRSSAAFWFIPHHRVRDRKVPRI
jgi:hypothetical protein